MGPEDHEMKNYVVNFQNQTKYVQEGNLLKYGTRLRTFFDVLWREKKRKEKKEVNLETWNILATRWSGRGSSTKKKVSTKIKMIINFIYLLVKRISTSSWLLLRKLDLFLQSSYCHSHRIYLVRLEALQEREEKNKNIKI